MIKVTMPMLIKYFSIFRDVPAFSALIDGDGEFVEYLRLPGLLFRKNSWKDKERQAKVSAH